jgi:magnesium transporter
MAQATETKVTPDLLYLLHGDPQELAETVAQMRTADVAEALAELRPEAGARVLAALSFDLAVQLLEEPGLDRERPEIIRLMDPSAAAALIDAMSADEQADLFRDLAEKERARLMKHLDKTTREALKLLLAYPVDTAGGIMTTEFVAVPTNWTAEQTLRHIAEVGTVKETVYAIYVVDPASGQLVHVVSLRDVTVADPNTEVIELGDRRAPLTVTPLTDREDVARMISRYDLLAVPVVDEQSRVIGIVTVDDVIDAMVREQTEDVHKFGGIAAFDEPYNEIGIVQMVRKRGGWLTVLFLGQTLTASAMGLFEQEIERAVVLALFIPLIISSGGNSGSQATSLIIRAMALRQVSLLDWWRVALRELWPALLLGALLGVLGFLRIVVWQLLGWSDFGPHYVLLAVTIGLALLGVVTVGSMTGSMLPFVLRRLGFDPASASAPFVATLVDVTGVLIYFALALLLLRGTVL